MVVPPIVSHIRPPHETPLMAALGLKENKVPSIYHHELQAYRVELSELDARFAEIATPGKVENVTHAAFGFSNRMSFMLVGMCSLVEAYLFELTQSNPAEFNLADLKGQGITRLKLYLSRTGVVAFGELKNWDKFSSIYKIRNEIVHSYGGMAVEDLTDTISPHIKKLGFTGVLIAGRRIRVGREHMTEVIGVVDGLLDELGAYKT